MSGETDLIKLLQAMAPELIDGDFVFCSLADASYGDYAELQPLAAIDEAEGLTLILPKANADAQGLDYDGVFRGITLRVHSSLDAVGLTATISARLAELNISANVVAGFYHDHIFVQRQVAADALAALEDLARSASA